MTETELLRCGQILDGKYRVEARIGAGGMGTVYRARHLTLGALRAVKVIRRDLSEDRDIVERFRSEALLAEGLRHPNLVALYDFAVLEDGTPYIVWEYVEGTTLAERLALGDPFAPEDVVTIVGQVADGLAAAHRQGILHRDISPDNIMIAAPDGAPVAKLLDFGIAKMAGKRLRRTTRSGMLLGKIGYLAPEQIGLLDGGGVLDARSDVFSLATVAYQMLLGHLPFRASSLQTYLQDVAILEEADVRARVLASLPEPWRTVFRAGLARERDERTATMEALKRDLESALASGVSMPCTGGEAAATATETELLETRVRTKHEGSSLSRLALALLCVVLLAGGLGLGYTEYRLPDRYPAVAVPPKASSALAPKLRAMPSDAFTPSKDAGSTSSSTSAVTPRPAHPAPEAEHPPARPDVVSPTSTIPPMGELEIETTPNASVVLDGELVGVTPWRHRVAPGQHDLVLVTTNGLRWRGKLAVEAGEVATVTRRLDLYGAINVGSDVWAFASLDGGAPQQTPFAFRHVGAGLHELRVFRTGYREQIFEIVVEPDETSIVTLEMEKEP